MKLKWLLISLLPVLHMVLCSNEEEQALRLPELAVADGLGDQVAVVDSQKETSTGEDGEQRRVRGRNMKRRRRLRKRFRTTTEPPQDELNEQLNIAEQNQEAADDQPQAAYESQKEAFDSLKTVYDPPKDAYEQPRTAEETLSGSEEPVTAISPMEDTTRRRGKRRRRPHRKYLDAPLDGQQTPGEQEGDIENPKPPRRRRKGGRKRLRPTAEPTEPNKVELYIETTIAPQVEEVGKTEVYIVDNLTEPPVTRAPDTIVPHREPATPVYEDSNPPTKPRLSNISPTTVIDHTDPPISIQGMIREDKPTVFRYYDSRHNSISVIDGNEQSKYPDLLQIPESSQLPAVQPATDTPRYRDRYSDVQQSRFPEPSRFPDESQFDDHIRFTSTPQLEPTRSHQSVNIQQHPTRGLVLPHFSNPSWSQEPPSFHEETKSPKPTQFFDTQPTFHSSRSPGTTRLEPQFTVVINHEPEVFTDNSVKQKPYSAKPTANIIKPVQEHIQESEPEPSERHESRVDQGTNEVPSQAPTQTVSNDPEYGSKAFDRKVLFSKSRKLPVTSAIIRKKLTPHRVQSGEGKAKDEITTKKQLIPEGFTEQPLTMEPSKLIEKLKAHAKSYRTTTTPMPTTLITTEEPNYPKFESRKREKNSATESIIKTTTDASRFNKVIELHRSRGKVVITTMRPDPIDITTENLVEVDTTEPGKVISDAIVEETTVPSIEDLNLDKLNDSIVDLLRSESGNMELTEILESRNMTLAQLLEHREKGSRHFHLGDLFSQKKALIGENTTASMASDKAEAGTQVYLEHQTIPFPNQDVLGSFPSFVSDKIEGVIKKNSDGVSELVTRKSVHLDNREPRVFDSMPEFNDKRDAPWRLPNPKLRPVSIRGDVEEIKISLRPLENPKSENDIDNSFLAAEDKADVLRTNRISSTLEAESVGSHESGFAKFKRIPVTVKSAIIISVAILMLAIFGFLSILISCRLRQKKARLRAKQEILCEHLKNEDFMNSQQSLSPVLNKQSRGAPPVFSQNNLHPNTASNRNYYLWRTLRKTFQYD